MKQPAVQLPIIGLITANAVAGLLLWHLLNVEPALIPPPKKLTPSSASSSATPTLKKVTRAPDPAVERLFAPASPSAESSAVRADAPAPKTEPAMRLVGVIIDDSQADQRVALVEYGQPARVARLHAGSQLNSTGWRVDGISLNAIAISRGGEHIILELR